MHHIYETQAFVLMYSNTGEADRLFTLYTREFGFIRATAQGVRKISSKLRFSLQLYSYSQIHLVRGKGGWRITNAQIVGNYYQAFKNSRHKLNIIGRIFSLLRRMLHGEEKQVQLFKTLQEGFTFLKCIPDELVSDFEVLLVLRILYQLGYVGTSTSLSPFLQEDVWLESNLIEAGRKREDLIRSVNDSLRASQL